MTTRTYGAGYVEVYDLDVYEQNATAAGIARLIRQDLKAAQKVGEFPDGVSFSVRWSFAGGRSVDVEIKGFTGPITCPECKGHRNRYSYAARHGDLCQTCATWDGWLSPEAAALHSAVESIRQAYNYDGSDVTTDYSDVNYYGSTSFDRRYSEVAS